MMLPLRCISARYMFLTSSDINLLSHDINRTTKRNAQRCRKRIVGPLIRRDFLTKSKKTTKLINSQKFHSQFRYIEVILR